MAGRKKWTGKLKKNNDDSDHARQNADGAAVPKVELSPSSSTVESESELVPPSRVSNLDLPSFKTQHERAGAAARGQRRQLIEQDAISTIREHNTVMMDDVDGAVSDAGSGSLRGAEKDAVDHDITSDEEPPVQHEEHTDHFRKFVRSATRDLDEKDSGKGTGFLERFISLTGGGMVPAANQERSRTDDFESEAGKAEVAAEIEATAKQIVQAHHMGREQISEETYSVSDAADAPLFTPMPQHYDDEYNASCGEDNNSGNTYVDPPSQVRGGVLGSLLQLYQGEKRDRYSKSSDNLSSDSYSLPNFKSKRPKGSKLPYSAKLKRKNNRAEARITVHIAALLQRHRFLLRLCKALMMYGAPTHRLEEYMVMTSRVLEIDGQFLYMPGCMVVSFGDTITRTSDVQLVRCTQGLNLWKLHQVHAIYKQVVHDIISVEDANLAIDTIMSDKNLYPAWFCVLLYGFCSSMITPYAFGGDWINLLVSFGIGCCVGTLQFIVAPRWNVYSNVFEISASIVVSFCARALGSIPGANICFGSTVQGSLALILPGYMILCGSLELQSRNLVAGSVRMFYAIIYSLFLGFGITLGAALFGWIYKDATNETTCAKNISPWYRFIFVPATTLGLSLVNQARWTQVPMMIFISCCGYVVTFWAGQHFSGSTEFTASMGAFVIGIMGNLYSRIWKGLAMTAMLPGILVQVPSGIASKSTLLSSIESANNIVSNKTNVLTDNRSMRSSLSFGVTMIQVTIGISVGLFASTLFVYPFGKKRTGLFTL
ncbi:HBR457Wp [Eremothecium sinecaudum]|uniref:Pheromone-regulated membrane protein 10 n=1 Tax=Eremothecium sinecaudum TaxID=45286 RepID=A0A109UXN5_9SACH|nr:HBR457Wp [Eremothecium sinecaudum]AMD19358.1 HBR457Wp [Eremothecium sinecaudum]